jgi:transcriptional regulator
MYQPPSFREDRLAVQHDLVRAHPLGALVSAGEGGLVANHVPMSLDAGASALGTLRCHLSRANPQWRDLATGAEALVIFQGPQAYVTPSWYETKRETHKVVPTWNYAVVQASGPLQIIEDPDWLARQIGALTALQESVRPEPWSVEDAPAPFIAAQLKGIVGIEIPITRIEGKWKVSQNRPEADRIGVAEGLARSSDPSAGAMADLVAGSGPNRRP